MYLTRNLNVYVCMYIIYNNTRNFENPHCESNNRTSRVEVFNYEVVWRRTNFVELPGPSLTMLLLPGVSLIIRPSENDFLFFIRPTPDRFIPTVGCRSKFRISISSLKNRQRTGIVRNFTAHEGWRRYIYIYTFRRYSITFSYFRTRTRLNTDRRLRTSQFETTYVGLFVFFLFRR